MTESPSTSLGGSLPSFVLTAFLYIERSCGRIILEHNPHLLSIHIFQHDLLLVPFPEDFEDSC